jgi:folate-binding protein YgfZ
MDSLLLLDFHRAAGAAFVEVNGRQAVLHYGDWRAEYDALRHTAGVLDLSFRGRLCLLGADRLRFLNGQVTNNIKDLAPGQGCYAALVSAKGKLQTDLHVYRLQDELLLDFEPGLSARVTERLEKFIIAEDVQIVDVAPHYGLLSVQGPKAADLLRRLATPLPLPDNPMAIAKADGEIYVSRLPRLRSDGFDLFVPVASLRPIAGQLAAAGCLCGWQALETARIEDGIPRFGIDMDETNLAPEALDSRAISYAKGCYIGQEVIARIRTYGQVAKSLRRLRIDGDLKELPAPGAKLFLGDKEAGYITSSARSPAFQTVIALGYIRRDANNPGLELTVQTPSGKAPVRIVELPPS